MSLWIKQTGQTGKTPQAPRKMCERRRRLRPAALASAAVCLALTLSGCAEVDTTSRCPLWGSIALTFDAGPSENSARLLDILKEKKVPATFFLLGKRHTEKYPELVKRMAAEGHEVASHTWDHKILTRISDDRIRGELQRPDDAIERLTGRKPTLMRPP